MDPRSARFRERRNDGKTRDRGGAGVVRKKNSNGESAERYGGVGGGTELSGGVGKMVTAEDAKGCCMKERPILFSGPMVRAILEGRKTMTRRVVKPQPYINENGVKCWGPPTDGRKYLPNGPRSATGGDFFTMTDLIGRYCPYGLKGDRLWVRETWSMEAGGTDKDSANFHATFLADLRVKGLLGHDDVCQTMYDTQRGQWRPSIFMPRWASRITLEITGVRIERLQEITEHDAESEGSPISAQGDRPWFSQSPIASDTHKLGFVHLWDSINADRPKLPKDVNSKRYASVKRWLEKHPPCAWDDNPWVWVVEFDRV